MTFILSKLTNNEMANNDSAISEILNLLKKHPRGLPVKDISNAIGMNRMSVARYLDVMRSSGQVDMVPFGKAKVYFLSSRIPISTIMDYSSDYLLILNEDRRIVDLNENFSNLIDSEKEDLPGKYITDLFDCLSPYFDILSKLEEILEGKKVCEEINILKNESQLFFTFETFQVVLTDGCPGILILLKDITEKKLLKDQLMAKKRLYESLLENIDEFVMFINHKGILNYVSKKSEYLVGYLPEEMTGTSIFEYLNLNTKEVEKFISMLNSHDNNSPIAFESDFIHKNGDLIFLSIKISNEYTDLNVYGGFQVICSVNPLQNERNNPINCFVEEPSICNKLKNSETIEYKF
ncbi:PAS domain-containing protein [Methanoplanus sp. FWC-SCC4]|uniref:PAS domain-containing protein n=1 Tax=Methanochimaera problematica TaxID=2609417 RepID=A0AA97FD43_9EURY|nr:PAS domain-containing protein [Methanoplanus sp. FWC-SCC4]WOF16337.1 PAS domain-containing protein [Methanoplanus sp. FWC-SCC4]